jgi:prolyl-tRNA synthetase
MKFALKKTRAQFADWYQEAVRGGDLAVSSPVRGCMIIRGNGYGLWQQIQRQLNDRIEQTGHENLYFPLFIPLSFIAKEATHVEGFAKEMAVVTHHRLHVRDGQLVPDPEARLTEPLIVRPTSETIIGHHFRECVQTYRDLPLLWNQWANVVRWELRTRLFLRTTEFLWQEGHTCHADREEAMAETLRMLEVYRDFAENVLAMPVIAGEKPANERFPGAENTFSIEAMMQDGKALQAATSHYLGTHFAQAQDIQFQDRSGQIRFCHTTSWGASTRLIGGVVMTHGDDDGLRLPPMIAPKQVVIVPLLRAKGGDGQVLEYCWELSRRLSAQSYGGVPIRVHLDLRDERSVEKRWSWLRKGAPIICEIGPEEIERREVSYIRRNRPRQDDKLASTHVNIHEFVGRTTALLAEIQASLLADARTQRDARIVDGLGSVGDVQSFFGTDGEGGEDATTAPGWVRCAWSRPQGAELESVVDRLKELRVTIRNAPLAQDAALGTCMFTGRDAVEQILIGRSY